MGQDEHGDVVWRLVAPPALLLVIWPSTTDRTEHISVQNPGANVLEAARGKRFVQTVGTGDGPIGGVLSGEAGRTPSRDAERLEMKQTRLERITAKEALIYSYFENPGSLKSMTWDTVFVDPCN